MARWTKLEQEEAFAWFAAHEGVTVFRDVPVTRPLWRGWPDETQERLETVAIGRPGTGTGKLLPFDEDAFDAAVAQAQPVRPLRAYGYADRPVFGWALTRQAFVARTWQPQGPVLPVIIVGPGHEKSNVSPVYRAHGIEIVATGPAPERERSGGKRAGPANGDPWASPRSIEDHLLNSLWHQRGRQGWWLAEVPVGGASRQDAGARRFDSVVVPSWPTPRQSAAGVDLDDFESAVKAGCEVELIEAKADLNADAIGQLLSGAHMFSSSFSGHGTLRFTLCVRRQNDFALRWFCARLGIVIEHIQET